MVTNDLFIEVSLIIVLASMIAGVMKLIKQPLIIAYIATGLLAGPSVLNLVKEPESLEVFSKFGVSILLFIIGISLSPKVIKDTGKIALVTGLSQIFFTTIFGFLISKGFGYTNTESLYVAIALTFSSTIIVMKLISDKKETEKLYARVAIGFLLVQDIVATGILIFVSTLATAGNGPVLLALTIIRGFAIAVFLIVISAKLLPKIGDFFANSQEFLFLVSIGWGLGIASLFKYIGLSMEIGALIAGVSLSVTPYAHEISSKLKPLRDFFIIIFFIFLGSTLKIDNIPNVIIPAIVFSIYILIGNPLILTTIMGFLGYNKKTSFNAGLTVAQISEFSLILILLGVHLGHLNNLIMSLVTLVGVITIAGSTYMVLYSEKLYPFFEKYLGIFEKKKPIQEKEHKNTYDVILFGCNRVGYDFVRLFKDIHENFIAVDFDPAVVSKMTTDGLNCIYGDAEDSEFLDEICVTEAKMVISTIPDQETNFFLIEKIRQKQANSILITISYDLNSALEMYEKGATYVILPHFIGGQFASELASNAKMELNKLLARREEHITYLNERKTLGHNHPQWKKTDKVDW